MIRIRTLVLATSIAACLGGAMPASAALLFDRGLPTTNLNNAALGDRSNVGWGGDGVNLFTGDDFKIGVVGQTYVINSLTVWGSQVDPLSADLSQIALYVGKDGGPLSLLSSGNLRRLRICPNCNWLFLDRSRNSSRLWCDMAVCGNRQKAKRHYLRHRAPERGGDHINRY